MSKQTSIHDNSNDHKYFILTPQIVLALSRTPQDFTLWNVIKMIAAEKGECFLPTDDLAVLSMMSTGKVSDCRQYLMAVGVLEGVFKKDPGFPQPVWHITIPDIWDGNIKWRTGIDSLKDRVKQKQYITQQLKEGKQLRSFNIDKFIALDISQYLHFKSLHNMKPSQYEMASQYDRGAPQNDGGVPQNDAKKNQQEKPKEKPDSNYLIIEQLKKDLSRQMTKATYDAIVAKIDYLNRANGTIKVGVSQIQYEWLENRLNTIVVNALNLIEPGLKIEYVVVQ